MKESCIYVKIKIVKIYAKFIKMSETIIFIKIINKY